MPLVSSLVVERTGYHNFSTPDFFQESLMPLIWEKNWNIFLGSARFPEMLQNFSECHVLWRMCSVVFHALTLKLPI